MRKLVVSLSIAVTVLAAACSSTPNGSPPNPPVEAVEDGGTRSPGPADVDGSTTKDAGSDVRETCTPSGDILGTLASGACCALKAKLTAKTPSLDTNVLVFAPGETYDRASLSPGGQRLYDTPNAGGSSTESEVMSFEVLRYCEGASLVKTETEIAYQAPDDAGANTITDILVAIDGHKIGVSVTRAYRPPSQTLTDDIVKALLEKKLEGINRSSERVVPADKWVKQILHVFSVNKDATDAVARVYPTIDGATRADTIVLVTQTTGGGFVYCNTEPPLGSECP